MSYLFKYYLFQFCKYLVLIISVQIARCDLQSPCPNVFEYRYDGASQLYGFIKVPIANDGNNNVQLDVQLSVGNSVQGFSGNIELAIPRSQILEDLRYNRPLQYNVYFPYWSNIPPKITSILLNGRQICYGNPIAKHSVPLITTVNLQHTLSGVASRGGPQRPTQSSPDVNYGTRPKTPSYYDKPTTNQNNGFFWTPGNKFLPDGNFNLNNNNNPTNWFTTTTTTTTTTTPKPVFVNHMPPTQLPRDSAAEDLPTVENNLVQKPFSNICGIPSNVNTLVINGNNVTKGAHPWLGALFMQINADLRFLCGSSLISQKHVITAAHCVRSRKKRFKPEELWVFLGRENIQRWSNDGSQSIQVETTHIHPNYQFDTADADIALIVLNEEAIFSTIIRPICLWTGDIETELIVGKTGTIVGWGKDENGRIFTPEPKQIVYPVVSEEDCLRSNTAFLNITSNRTFCGGYRNNSGPCNGDSGSGFLMRINERWTLRGVVSMSLLGPDKNCDLEQYIVFTDVAKHLDWILSFLR